MSDPREHDSDRTQVIFREGSVFHGRYTLVSCVGEGGMGVVWRARDERLKRDVALKFLPERVRRDPEAIRDLLDETRRCLDLTHANIVRVYDLIEDAQAAAIAMEYVAGQSLSALKAARPHRCFDPADLVPLLRQLCAALDYAHSSAKIVHRDLKPANMIVTADGVLKVADFGIARSLVETHTRHTGDLRGASGTLPFMGPQQLLNKPAAAADDIYALGATLYDLLTGKPPFYAGDLVSQIHQLAPEPLEVRRTELRNQGGPIPKKWEETILLCLAKKAEARPPSARAVLALLECRVEDRDKTIRIEGAGPEVGATPNEPAPTPEPGQRWTIPELGLELVPIAAGTFTMGSPASEQGREDDEGPQTRVTLSKGFWLSKTEVTQREWRAVMGNNPSDIKGDDRPVEMVSWEEAMAFCRKLTEQERTAGRLPEGYGYTLPTEAQWEYACRAGTTGEYAGNLDEMGWYNGNSGSRPVGTKRANAWGLHDMHGNVWEWCSDWYGNYPGGSVTDPKGAGSGSLRVLRGGSWSRAAVICRSANRLRGGPGLRNGVLGVRLALAPSP